MARSPAAEKLAGKVQLVADVGQCQVVSAQLLLPASGWHEPQDYGAVTTSNAASTRMHCSWCKGA